MPDGGRLTISTANHRIPESPRPPGTPDGSPGDYLRLTVSDSGCGIDGRTMPRIFEPFFTTKETGKGTGLGLSTVYGIVARSGGHIRVDSAPGRGATFDVLFPRVPEAPEADGDPAGRVRPDERWRGTETVLVAEDEPQVREYVTDLLTGHGYRVLGAADGLEALEILGKSPGIRFVFVSGYSENAARIPAGMPEGTQILQKPFRAEATLRAVRTALDAG